MYVSVVNFVTLLRLQLSYCLCFTIFGETNDYASFALKTRFQLTYSQKLVQDFFGFCLIATAPDFFSGFAQFRKITLKLICAHFYFTLYRYRLIYLSIDLEQYLNYDERKNKEQETN